MGAGPVRNVVSDLGGNMPDRLSLGMQTRAAAFRPSSVDAEARTAELVWTTGATVRRVSWRDGAYDEELVVEPGAVRLDRLNGGAPLLKDHDSWTIDSQVGVIESARVEGGQGLAIVRFAKDEEGERVFQKVADGILRNVSVGYRIHRIETTERDGQVPLARVVDWEPMEISLVTIPADAGAGVRSERAGATENPVEVITRGTPPTAESEARKTMPTENENNDAARAEAVAAERNRVKAIRALGEKWNMAEVATSAIDEGRSEAEAREAILEAVAARHADAATRTPAQNAGPATRILRAEEDTLSANITTALLARGGVIADAKVTDGARKWRSLTLPQVAREFLTERGIQARFMSDEQAVSAAFQYRSGSYHHTSDFGAILSNTAIQAMRVAETEVEVTYRDWADEMDSTSLHDAEFAALGEVSRFDDVSEGGEYTYATVGDKGERIALRKKGKIIAVNEEVILKDRLGQLTDIPAKFAREAMNTACDLAYDALDGNLRDGNPVFRTEAGNLLSGDDIDEDSYELASIALREQKGENERTLRLRPRVLLVGPRRERQALKLVAPVMANTTNAVNPYAGAVRVVTESRVGEKAGNPWFLIGDKAQHETVRVVWFGGRGAQVTSRDGFAVDGLEIKARVRVGAGALARANMVRVG